MTNFAENQRISRAPFSDDAKPGWNGNASDRLHSPSAHTGRRPDSRARPRLDYRRETRHFPRGRLHAGSKLAYSYTYANCCSKQSIAIL